MGRKQKAKEIQGTCLPSRSDATSEALPHAPFILRPSPPPPFPLSPLKAFPNSSHTYQAWACLEKDRGNWELAFSLFRSGIAKRPWDGGAYQPYALALKERGEMTAAMEIFQKGLQEDPYHCPLYQVLGHSVCHFGASHVNRALIRSRRHTHRCSALNPSSTYLLTNYVSNQAFGMLLAELGRTDAARSIFERGTQTNPRGRHVYYIWHAWAVMEEKSGESGLLLSSPYLSCIALGWWEEFHVPLLGRSFSGSLLFVEYKIEWHEQRGVSVRQGKDIADFLTG